jgi:hypothetical protein
MIEPKNVAADPELLETLAKNLITLAPLAKKAIEQVSLNDAGLDTPSRTLTIFGEDARRSLAVLDIGKVVGDGRYVRSQKSKKSIVVDASALLPVEMPAVKWRDNRLVRMVTANVTNLDVTNTGKRLVLDRDRAIWRINEPFQAIADEARAEGAISEVTSLRVVNGATGFVADDVQDLKPFGLDQPMMTITLKAESTSRGGVQTILIGRPEADSPQRVYARRSDQDDVVLINAAVLRTIGLNPLDLHAKKVLDFLPENIQQVRLENASGTVVTNRTNNGWQRVQPLRDQADNAAIERLLVALQKAEASEVFAPGKAPDPQLEKPWTVIELRDKVDAQASGSPPLLRLKIGRRDALKKTAYCQVEGDQAVIGVPLAVIDAVPYGPLAFRDRLIQRTILAGLESIEIKAGNVERTLETREGRNNQKAWVMSKPVVGPTDQGAMTRLLNALALLHAESLIAEKPDAVPNLGFENPFLTVVWKSATNLAPMPFEVTTLTVGKEVPQRAGVRYAKISSSPILFTLSPEVLATFQAELFDRTVMRFSPKDVQAITLRWEKESLTLRPVPDIKTGDPEWAISGPLTNLKFDLERVKTLVKALASLTTSHFAQYDGPFKPEYGMDKPRLQVELRMSNGRSVNLRIGSRSLDRYLFATIAPAATGPVFFLPIGDWSPWFAAPKPVDSGPEATPKK